MNEKDVLKLRSRIEKRGFKSGEKAVFLAGAHAKDGWIGATIGQMRELPYRTRLPGDFSGLQAPEWPAPHPAVRAGRFMGDEWVHDQAIWGWCYADAPGRAAVQLADMLMAFKQYSWLIASDYRLAVLLEQERMEAERIKPDEPESEDEPDGLLGKAKAFAGAFSRGSASSEKTEEFVTTLEFQFPLHQVAGFSLLELGRFDDPEKFLRIQFADHSVLDFRTRDAPFLAKRLDRAVRR